ncbi:hypothetical protein RISK_005120 [Rhodopirellula islandica]|uniref:Uncharacterized protein n=1 Tax=Rhodopirellula islandica TaxID=595434 RepID=A0A0J1EB55_RHOIS|nr:hypothetical protein RISK_005120 [Rhodopirellula islandica]
MLLRRVTQTIPSGLRFGVAWRLRTARRNSWGQLFYSGICRLFPSPRTGPPFLARGGSPENDNEQPNLAPDGAVVGDTVLYRGVTQTIPSGLGFGLAWQLKAARRNSWGQRFYSGACRLFATAQKRCDCRVQMVPRGQKLGR